MGSPRASREYLTPLPLLLLTPPQTPQHFRPFNNRSTRCQMASLPRPITRRFKADNKKIQGLKQVVGKLQLDVAANSTLLIDLINQIHRVHAKIDDQDKILKYILHHLRNPTPTTPSFTDADQKDLKIVAEFGILATTAFAELEERVEKQEVAEKARAAAKVAEKAIASTSTTDTSKAAVAPPLMMMMMMMTKRGRRPKRLHLLRGSTQSLKLKLLPLLKMKMMMPPSSIPLSLLLQLFSLPQPSLGLNQLSSALKPLMMSLKKMMPTMMMMSAMKAKI